jgi:hypothetical protein
MNRAIYLLAPGDQLVEMREQAYDSEDLLQRLLATHPDLLAGDQIDPATPCRWLLVSREMPVPGDAGLGGRWSVDHLFIDQEGVPTLVEVKRGSDSRIRREVVGQMLDYAANAVVYWPIEHLLSRFETTCRGRGADAEQVLTEHVGPGMEAESFWQKVKTNLQAGRIRMIFVADEIPAELRRIVEFLNEQMDPAEVLALEVKQYAGRDLRTLVPIVIGQTAEAQRRKGVGQTEKRQWDEPSFFQHLRETAGEAPVRVARAILDWARPRSTRIWWGRGRTTGSFVPVVNVAGVDHQLFAVYSGGVVEIYFQWYVYRPPFTEEAKRRELLDRLNAIPGVSLPPDSITRRPSIPLAVLAEESRLVQFFDVFEWYLNEVQGPRIDERGGDADRRT